MSRRQAIYYLCIAIGVLAVLLFFLAIFNIWLMVLTLVLLALCLVLALRFRPEWFQVFRKEARPEASKAVSESIKRPREEVFVPRLILVADNKSLLPEMLVNKPVFTIGRDEDCDYVIPNVPEISRIHATICYEEGSGLSYLVDNDSNNGTYLNGMRLAPSRPHRINNGDFVQFGALRFTAQAARY